MTATLLMLLFLLILGAFKLFVFGAYTVKDRDSNTFLATGDYVLFLQQKKPDYGDFVVYEVEGETYLGRVMGKAQDQLMSVEDILYRNQEVVHQPFIETMKRDYLSKTNHEYPFTPDFNLEFLLGQPNATVPKGHYFILNDNRQQLTDSRQLGPISASAIKGVLTFRLKPFDQFGFLRTE